MKNIQIFTANKYNSKDYHYVSENIYRTFDKFMNQDCYVTSLSFEQEPEYGEGIKPTEISQYPLEDILDKFCVAVNDFYDDENQNSNLKCYLEFSASSIDDIESLITIVGKHVYNKKRKGENQETIVSLEIE